MSRQQLLRRMYLSDPKIAVLRLLEGRTGPVSIVSGRPSTWWSLTSSGYIEHSARRSAGIVIGDGFEITLKGIAALARVD